MVCHLLRQILKVIRHEFKGLPQHRIERLGRRAFANSQCGDDMHGDESMPPGRVLLLGRHIQQVVVFHRLRALLEETCWIVEVDGYSHARKILPYRVLQDGPDARPRVWVFEPR